MQMAVWLSTMLHAAYLCSSTFPLQRDMMARMKAGMAQTRGRLQQARAIMELMRAYIETGKSPERHDDVGHK